MNLLDPTWDGEVTRPDGTSARAVQLARHAGAARLGATLYEPDPGAAASPLHYHHRNQELLFVLSGAPTLRTPGRLSGSLPESKMRSSTANIRGPSN